MSAVSVPIRRHEYIPEYMGEPRAGMGQGIGWVGGVMESVGHQEEDGGEARYNASPLFLRVRPKCSTSPPLVSWPPLQKITHASLYGMAGCRTV